MLGYKLLPDVVEQDLYILMHGDDNVSSCGYQ